MLTSRLQTDKQEAQLKAEQRRVQIERANKILFDDSDKVKGFHSKMLLCDVMQENAELIEYKKQIEVLKRAQEQAFVEQQSQQMEVGRNVLTAWQVIRERDSLECNSACMDAPTAQSGAYFLPADLHSGHTQRVMPPLHCAHGVLASLAYLQQHSGTHDRPLNGCGTRMPLPHCTWIDSSTLHAAAATACICSILS